MTTVVGETSTTFAQSFVDIGARGAQRREQTGNHSRYQGDRSNVTKYSPVQRQSEPDREITENAQRFQRVAQPTSKQGPSYSASKSQKNGFGQHLPDQMLARGTHGGADSHFFLSRGSSC